MSRASHVSAETAPAAAPADLALAWQQLGSQWLQWWSRAAMPLSAATAAASATSARSVVPPERFAALTREYQAKLALLWQAVAASTPGAPLPEVAPLPAHDRRFRGPAWRTSPFHSLIAQAYLLYGEYLNALADSADVPEPHRKRLRFLTRQYVDAIAPSNFAATNPEVLARALATDGASVAQGAANLVADIGRGRMLMSDETAFRVGSSLAVTPGSVVFRNDLIELIQYAPSTTSVHARPLVIVPPCINKYYILDLSPSNSFVRECVAQGHTTFIVSWRNIPPALAHLTWDDYLEQGALQAIRVAQAIGGGTRVNALGFCVGGTLLACALAVLAARDEHPVHSATFLATMLDFEDPGDIGVYVTREFLAAREPGLRAGQRLHGSELATAFATLRANDLVWNYVVNNYLLGGTPPAFDLLYWNGDAANLPGPMYAFYLRELYLENRLRLPGALTMLGESIDLSRIAMPVYALASRDDHIVPWRSAFRTTGLVGGDTTFTLAASGHIAGVVNPPSSARRNHWINPRVGSDPDEWLAGATRVPGSWWPHWNRWLAKLAGPMGPARAAQGNRKYPALSPAPGRYVTEVVG